MINTYNMQITNIFTIAKDIFCIKGILDKDMTFMPGNFVNMVFCDKDNKKIKRPYSVATYKDRQIMFIIKPKPNGFMSNQIINMYVNSNVILEGPYGHFTYQAINKEPIFITTGTGLAGITSIIQKYLDDTNYNITLFYSFRNDEDEIKLDLLNNSRINLIKIKTSINPRINMSDILKIDNYKNKIYYLCGQQEMTIYFEKELKEKVGKDVFAEKW